jgi:hypothetical protein
VSSQAIAGMILLPNHRLERAHFPSSRMEFDGRSFLPVEL